LPLTLVKESFTRYNYKKQVFSGRLGCPKAKNQIQGGTFYLFYESLSLRWRCTLRQGGRTGAKHGK
jgi:hypothetical protein